MTKEEILLIFSSNLRHRIKTAGYSVLAFAKIAGLSHNSLKEWTSGRAIPRVDSLSKICIVLKIELHELFK